MTDLQNIIADIIEEWLAAPNKIGLADDIRCAAMQVQDEYPEARAKDFVIAAEIVEVNGKTASRCWSYVKAQSKA
jgi:hypothetical protein